LGGLHLRRSRNRFVAQRFFGPNPVLYIFSVFAAAFEIQLMGPASDFFSGWIFASKPSNLLGCKHEAGEPTSVYEMRITCRLLESVWPVAVDLIT
jgi:hypothetical protein